MTCAKSNCEVPPTAIGRGDRKSLMRLQSRLSIAAGSLRQSQTEPSLTMLAKRCGIEGFIRGMSNVSAEHRQGRSRLEPVSAYADFAAGRNGTKPGRA